MNDPRPERPRAQTCLQIQSGAAGRNGDSGKRDSRAGVEKMSKKKWRIKDGQGFVSGPEASLMQISKHACEVSTGTGGDYHRC